jgi:hypothetical protein
MRIHSGILELKIDKSYIKEYESNIKSIIDDYIDVHDCIPTSEYIQKKVYELYGNKNLITIFYPIHMTDVEALAWVSAESIDDSTNYRNVHNSEYPSYLYRNQCNIEKNWKCPICLNSNKKNVIVINHCNCTFHKSCLIQAYKYSTYCPTCKENLYREDIYQIVSETIV